jgi:hypothetical protein
VIFFWQSAQALAAVRASPAKVMMKRLLFIGSLSFLSGDRRSLQGLLMGQTRQEPPRNKE